MTSFNGNTTKSIKKRAYRAAPLMRNENPAARDGGERLLRACCDLSQTSGDRLHIASRAVLLETGARVVRWANEPAPWAPQFTDWDAAMRRGIMISIDRRRMIGILATATLLATAVTAWGTQATGHGSGVSDPTAAVSFERAGVGGRHGCEVQSWPYIAPECLAASQGESRTIRRLL